MYGKIEKPEKIESFDSILAFDVSKVTISFSKFIKKQISKDIYIGNEKIPFNKRHPIFKSLMKVEFEDAVRDYWAKRLEK